MRDLSYLGYEDFKEVAEKAVRVNYKDLHAFEQRQYRVKASIDEVEGQLAAFICNKSEELWIDRDGDGGSTISSKFRTKTRERSKGNKAARDTSVHPDSDEDAVFERETFVRMSPQALPNWQRALQTYETAMIELNEMHDPHSAGDSLRNALDFLGKTATHQEATLAK